MYLKTERKPMTYNEWLPELFKNGEELKEEREYEIKDIE